MTRPPIRDLMAKVQSAAAIQRECRDAEWSAANSAHHDAERELIAHLSEITGLTEPELQQLGALI